MHTSEIIAKEYVIWTLSAAWAALQCGSSSSSSAASQCGRSDIAFGDWHSVKQQIDKAKKLCDEGGDWERKNRLKVYEALFLMVTRDFKKAGELFLDSTATFGAYVSAFFFLYCTRFLLDCIGHHCCLLCCVSTYARIHAALAYLLMQTP